MSGACTRLSPTPSKAIAPSLLDAIEANRKYLLSLQQSDGHWCGELQGDTILESEYVLLLAFLGEENSENARKAALYILDQQQEDGSWSNYPGGPLEMSVSVKAYFALKLTGHLPSAPYMVKAREQILAHGGAVHCNSFTRFYLALLGQVPYRNCASVPPELVLLPRWVYVNLYAMSSWTRTIVVPLSIFSACKPVRHLPADKGIRELFVESPDTPAWPAKPTSRWISWTNFFLGIDATYKKLENWLGPIRRRALRKCETWMAERLEECDGLGAIFPPMIYTIIAYRCLGIADDDQRMVEARKTLDALILEEDGKIRLQPCFSPVWDTALTLNALGVSGMDEGEPAIRRGINWLLDREVRQTGDWQITNPGLAPGGWFFEYRNFVYPDSDDTAMVLLALANTSANKTTREKEAIIRAVNWLMGLQNRDGGWAAFDRDIDRQVLTKVPFADHNAMLDPSCPDITARVLEGLAAHGIGMDHSAVQKAVRFIEATQDSRGCWPGRWGVNYIYGTWQVLAGLQAVGYDMDLPPVRKAVAWIQSVQQEDGSWGESCASYDLPEMAGKGTSTASQSAWALLGLLAAGEVNHPSTQTGIDYLLRTQEKDGSWTEEPFTGTGFPKVFYLKYHYYCLYFPLLALSRYHMALDSRPMERENQPAFVGYTTT